MSGELWTSVLTIVGIGGLAAMVIYLDGRRYLDLDDSDAAIRRFDRDAMVVLAVTLVIAVLGLFETGWFGFVERALTGNTVDEPLGHPVVVYFAQLLGPFATAVIATIGYYPIQRAIRGGGPSTPFQVVYTVVGLSSVLIQFLLAIFALVLAGVIFPDLVAVVVGIVVALVVVVPIRSIIASVELSLRQVDVERDRLAPLDDLDIDVSSVKVSTPAASVVVGAEVVGLPGRRRIWISEPTLDADADVQRAVVGLAVGYARVFHQSIFLAWAFVGLAGLAPLVIDGAPAPPIPKLYFAAGMLALCFTGVWLSQYLVYRADDFAAGLTDPETVAEVIERVHDERDLPLEWSRMHRLFDMAPSPKQRIERLRARADG